MNILIHYKRTQSDPAKPFKSEKGDVIEFDNVNLYYIEVDRFGAGLVLPKDPTFNCAKVKTELFEDVTGYKFEDFEQAYECTFFGREISVWYEPRYGKLIPRSVQFGENCYIAFTSEASEEFQKNKEMLLQPADKK